MDRRQKIMRGVDPVLDCQPRYGHPHRGWNAPRAPVVKPLRCQRKGVPQNLGPDCVDKRAMLVAMSHDPDIHAALTTGKTLSLMEKHDDDLSKEFMADMAQRIKDRIDDLKISQRDAAKASGVSAQRFGNYVQGTRKPDIETLARIAQALGVSTDWLLGISEAGPVEIAPVVLRLLELDGVPQARAEVIAAAVQEALKILSALPSEGDVALRSRIAAQAAWQARGGSKPS